MAKYPREELQLTAKRRLYPLEIDGVTYQWNLYRGFHFTTGDVVHARGSGSDLESRGIIEKKLYNLFQSMPLDCIGVLYAEPPSWLSEDARYFWELRLNNLDSIAEGFAPSRWSAQFIFHGQQNGKEVKALIHPFMDTLTPPTFDRSSFVECYANSKRVRIGKRRIHLDELFLPCGNNLGRFIREDPNYSYVGFSVPAQLIIHNGLPAQRWIDEYLEEKKK